MQEIIIVGCGGHAAELCDYIEQFNRQRGHLRLLGLLDDQPDQYRRYRFGAPYLGRISDHKVNRDASYLIGIANLKYRQPIVAALQEQGAWFHTFIHPAATLSASATVGVGSVIGPYVNLGPQVRIGAFNLLNSRCSIGHDTVVGDHNFICPNVSFSGHTRVGDGNLFGINSATIPGVTVGSNNKIAAGMVLDKPVGDHETLFYRFREKVMAVPAALALS